MKTITVRQKRFKNNPENAWFSRISVYSEKDDPRKTLQVPRNITEELSRYYIFRQTILIF